MYASTSMSVRHAGLRTPAPIILDMIGLGIQTAMNTARDCMLVCGNSVCVRISICVAYQTGILSTIHV
jgi:hypothetical protein